MANTSNNELTINVVGISLEDRDEIEKIIEGQFNIINNINEEDFKVLIEEMKLNYRRYCEGVRITDLNWEYFDEIFRVINNNLTNSEYPSELKYIKILEKNKESHQYKYKIDTYIYNYVITHKLEKYINDDQQYFRKPHVSVWINMSICLIDYITFVKNVQKEKYVISLKIKIKEPIVRDAKLFFKKLINFNRVPKCLLKIIFSYFNDWTYITDMRDERVKKITETLIPYPESIKDILFALYVSDMKTVAKKFAYITDTMLVYSDSDIKTLEKKVNEDLKNIHKWIVDNKLGNLIEMEYLLHNSFNCNSTNQDIHLDLRNENSVKKDFIQFLGVRVDDKLNFEEHSKNIPYTTQFWKIQKFIFQNNITSYKTRSLCLLIQHIKKYNMTVMSDTSNRKDPIFMAQYLYENEIPDDKKNNDDEFEKFVKDNIKKLTDSLKRFFI